MGALGARVRSPWNDCPSANPSEWISPEARWDASSWSPASSPPPGRGACSRTNCSCASAITRKATGRSQRLALWNITLAIQMPSSYRVWGFCLAYRSKSPSAYRPRLPFTVRALAPPDGERANEVDPLLVIHLESSENGIGLIILNRGPDRNDLYQYQWSADAEL